MTLRQKQSLFVRLIGRLIGIVYEQGWELTFADAYRPDRQGHKKDSLHYSRLAIDLNLFVNGIWVTEDSAEWRFIGTRWKALHPLCRWGGDFASVDLNHFSLDHNGNA